MILHRLYKAGFRGLFLLLFLLAASCSQFPIVLTTSPINSNPPAEVTIADNSSLPDVEVIAQEYLEAWRNGDYPAMYQLLTPISQDAISEAEFQAHYEEVAREAALESLDYDILSSLTNLENAQVSYRVVLKSVLVGEVHADTLMNLSLEGNQWRVQWDDTLILPQLQGGNYLAMERTGYNPARANIYDRNGQALVAQTDATAIGLVPDQIKPEEETILLDELSEITGKSPEQIKSMYANFPVGAGWYLPIAEVPGELIADRYAQLASLSGLALKGYKARYYSDGGVASHLLGYVSALQPDEIEEYTALGYDMDDRIGRGGIEKWGENYLSGSRGGALYVLNSRGQPITRLAETPAYPGQSIYTTIDKEFQLAVEQAMSGFRGAAVVLERDTGRVLAMVSSPGYNPNAFEPINYNSDYLLAALESQDRPLFNRATLGQYPLGSVFKIITMAAALESGYFSTGSTYYCGHTFEELDGVTLYDWTYEYDFPPSGMLTLPGGLIRSCNPWFYHIGLDLFEKGLRSIIPDMAAGFGLGKLTGIEGIEETPGQVPSLESSIDATNQAIGQGALLVTPLQVANFIAAIGNGGSLLKPQVIEAIKPPDGEPHKVFEPEVIGQLPISSQTLEAIQKAMVGVITSTNPRGTAQHVFTGLDIPVAGKTGTAQTGSAPHAWFAGYTFAEREDRPDIAVAIIVENAGEGSDYAAPIFRRIIELYYFYSPGKLYEWEATYNVTRTPGPDVIETPSP